MEYTFEEINSTTSAHPDIDRIKAWIAALMRESIAQGTCPPEIVSVDYNWGEEKDSDPERAVWLTIGGAKYKRMIGFH